MDSILVYCVFYNGSIKPLYIYWNNKKIKIEKITYKWKTMEDNGINIHFSAISGEFYYHIVYVLSQSRWYIVETESAIA